MNRFSLLATALVFTFFASPCFAQYRDVYFDRELNKKEEQRQKVRKKRDLKVSYLGFDVVSQYLWRGFDSNDNDPAFQPSIELDLFQTGLSFNLWGSFGLKDDNNNANEVDYTLEYSRTLFRNKRYEVELSLPVTYYQYIANTANDNWEAGLGIAFTNLPKVGPGKFTPSYNFYYAWPNRSEGPENGTYNIFGLDYGMSASCPFSSTGTHDLNIGMNLGHTDGVGGLDSGFTYAEYYLRATMNLRKWSLSPHVVYQSSLEDQVNDEDEFWFGIGISYDIS